LREGERGESGFEGTASGDVAAASVVD